MFGQLVWPPRGAKGFGYDPMFVADGESLTFGEMEPEPSMPSAPRPRLQHCSSSLPRRLPEPAEAGFGVYVHWPFCAQKCPYCDFNSHVRHGGIDEARFLAAYLRELRHAAALHRAAHGGEHLSSAAARRR